MAKKLSEMILEELWQLFPIILTEHRCEWGTWFEEEKRILAALLPADAVISHIGSTAIRDIWAKPIVDVLIELPDETELLRVKETLTANGYLCMKEEKHRISLNKGYTENGFAQKVFHIHLRLNGDHDEILFRDYLNVHPDAAKEYEKLKLRIWKRYEHDRDGYTAAKTDFVAAVVNAAKESGAEDSVFIRPYKSGDEFEVSAVICETIRVSNAGDYPTEFIRENIESHSTQAIAGRAKDAHFYVVCDSQRIIGCGGITGYWGSTTESYLISIFVLPEFQGRDIGKRIVKTLENDEYFTRAWRTEVGSSITAVGFYRGLGYEFKNGITAPDESNVVRMEKRKSTHGSRE